MKFKSPTNHLFTIVALILLSGVQSNGQDHSTAVSTWIKIDDFESESKFKNWTLRDTRNETEPRVENPQVTIVLSEGGDGNKYLLKKPAAEGIVGNRKALSYRKLPVAIEVGCTYTIYTRINVEYFPNNHVFGLSNLEPEDIDLHDYNALEPSLRVTDKLETNGFKNDGTLMVRKDGDYAKIRNKQTNKEADPLQENTWYEIWFVVNNNLLANHGQKYDVFLRGGDEFPTQQNVFQSADFRMKRELPLIYFLTNCNTGPVNKSYGNGGLRYDDLHMTPGVVLTTPE